MDYLVSFAALRAELRARGWDRKATGRVLLENALHVAVLGAGAALFFVADSRAASAAGVLLAAAGSFGVATNAHTSSHGATSNSRALDAFLTYVGYPLLLGMSASYWRHKHIAVHHSAPNVLGKDGDADLAPLFAIHERALEGIGPLKRLWYGSQWALLPLLLALNGFGMLLVSWRFLALRIADRRRRRPSHLVDAAVIALHLVLWLGIPLLIAPAADVLAFYALRAVLMGYTMFAAFAPAHLPARAICVDGSADTSDYVLAVTATTVNYRTGWLGRLLCSGVEYQIEHHLFPRFSHVHYPKMAPLVAEFCRVHGYPYRTLGWARGISEALAVFRVPKKVQASLSGT